MDAFQIIRSHQDEKLVGRVFLAHVGERVDGVGGLGQIELHFGGAESQVVTNGAVHQFQPLIVVEQGLFVF